MTNGPTGDDRLVPPGTAYPYPGSPGPGTPPGYGSPTGSPTPGWQGGPPMWQGTEPTWPGVVPLRPLSFSDILEGAFRVLRFNPKTMLGLTFIVLLVSVVLGGLITAAVLAATGGLSAVTEGTSTRVDASWAMNLTSLFLAGILIPPISEAVLGSRMSAGAAWRAVKGRLVSLIAASLLIGLMDIVLLVPLILAVVALIMGSDGGDAGVMGPALVGLLFLIPLSVIALLLVNALFMLSAPAIVLERLGPIEGLRRAVRLIRGGYWRAVGIQIVAAILVGLVTAILMIPLMGLAIGVVGGAVMTAGDGAGTGAALIGTALFAGLVMVAVGTFTQPFASAVTALLYLDRRFRTEDLAVALQQESDRRAALGPSPSGR